MDKLISVVVPIYNVENKLERCLDSLKNQTYKNIEILLINDGSPDNSREICLKYTTLDSRFKYFEKKNGGLSSARNYGILKANGEYIYFIDSDDYCENDLLENLISNMSSDVQISACGYYIEYPKEKIVIEKKCIGIGKKLAKDFFLDLDSNGMFNVVWNKLYNLNIIKYHNLGFEETMVPGEDLLFNCEYLKFIDKGVVNSKFLYHYMRENDETLVNKYDDNLIDKVKYFISKKEQLLNTLEINEDILKMVMGNTTLSYAFSCLTNLFRKKNKNKHKLIEIKKIIIMSRNENYYLYTDLNDKNMKLFIKLITINKPMLMLMIYNFLFFLRNNFNEIYLKYRAIIFKNFNN